MEYVAYGKKDATEEEKKMAKEFLKADKEAGRYQDGFAGIVAGLVKEDGKYILLWHNKKDVWTFPVGKVEEDESDEEALIRELKEEIAIDVKGHNLLGSVSFKENTGKDYRFHVFNVTTYSGTIKNNEPHKHARLKKVSKQELDILIKSGTCSPLIELVKDKGWL